MRIGISECIFQLPRVGIAFVHGGRHAESGRNAVAKGNDVHSMVIGPCDLQIPYHCSQAGLPSGGRCRCVCHGLRRGLRRDWRGLAAGGRQDQEK
ncbi:hypothetical protein AR274_21010 [Stenotrophomonas maltophilia]|nr:hypothetical protein AR274_21010 [Stenotrophomonas maltophilia]